MNKFREHIKTELADYLPDIAQHGCAGGFPGLTYYSDTVALFDKFRDDIFEILGEMADGMGQNILELVASFSGAADVGGFDQFANLCVWAAAEEVARSEEYLQEMEKEVAERD